MDDRYFAVVDGKNAGPFDLDGLRRIGLTRGVKVWREGMSEWTPVEDVPELLEALGPLPPALTDSPAARPTDPGSSVSPAVTPADDLATRRRPASDFECGYAKWATAALIVATLGTVARFFNRERVELLTDRWGRDYGYAHRPAPQVVALVSVVLAVAAVVLSIVAAWHVLRLVYRAWDSIQDGRTSMGPTAAVVGCLIPFVNVVWGFFALAGLGTSLQTRIDRKGIDLRVNATTAVVFLLTAGLAAQCLAVANLNPYKSEVASNVFAVSALAAGLVQLAASTVFIRRIQSACIALVGAHPSSQIGSTSEAGDVVTTCAGCGKPFRFNRARRLASETEMLTTFAVCPKCGKRNYVSGNGAWFLATATTCGVVMLVLSTCR